MKSFCDNRGRIPSSSERFLRRGNHVSVQFSVGGSSTSSGYPHVSLPGRLASPGLLSSSSSPGLGDGAPAMPGTGDCCQLGRIQSYSSQESGVSWSDPGLHSFQGFSLPAES